MSHMIEHGSTRMVVAGTGGFGSFESTVAAASIGIP